MWCRKVACGLCTWYRGQGLPPAATAILPWALADRFLVQPEEGATVFQDAELAVYLVARQLLLEHQLLAQDSRDFDASITSLILTLAGCGKSSIARL